MKIALVIIVLIVSLFVLAYAYYGGFKNISFRVEEQGGETVVYEAMVGDYNQTPKVQDKIYNALLNDEKIETTKGFGIYYIWQRELTFQKPFLFPFTRSNNFLFCKLEVIVFTVLSDFCMCTAISF